jgi:hypothetical protein
MSLIAQKLISASGATEATDDDFNLVTGLYHFDGSNGAQNKTFLDSSSNGFTVTRQGSTSQGTFTPFSAEDGKWSVQFPGSTTSDQSRIALSSTNEYVFGTGDFTIEAWIFPKSILAYSDANFVLDFRNGNAGYNIELYMFIASQGGTNNLYGTVGQSSGGITLGAWNHIAISRASGTQKGFINGVEKFSASDTANHQYSGSGVNIGNRYQATWNPFDGNISNVRIVKGTAVYTGNFTPSTSPLTNVTNTVNLGLRSNRFVDSVSSVVPYLNTTSGPIKIQPFSPFAPSAAYDAAVNGGSGYFDGDNDYLSVPDSTDFNFSSGEFTVEAWVYGADGGTSTGSVVYNQSLGGASSNSAVFFGAGTSGVSLYISTSGSGWTNNIIASVTVDDDAWHHLVWQRRGNLIEIYVDGTQSASASFSGTIYDSSRAVEIGAQNGGADFKDFISDLRVVKGSAVYSANFSPPTAPLTAVTNTKLLLNFTNSAAFDQTGKTNAITRANAKTSTAVTPKFGTASLYLDGTSDCVQLVNVVPIGTSPFTIEFFFRSNTTSLDTYYRRMYKMASVTGQDNAWCEICINQSSVTAYGSGNNIFMYTPGDTIIGTATPFDNNWHHFALTRDTSNNLKMFVDGTQDGSTVTGFTNNLTQTGHLVGANDTTGNGDFLGYIDELRLTMKARYTSNFSAPTKEFSNL